MLLTVRKWATLWYVCCVVAWTSDRGCAGRDETAVRRNAEGAGGEQPKAGKPPRGRPPLDAPRPKRRCPDPSDVDGYSNGSSSGSLAARKAVATAVPARGATRGSPAAACTSSGGGGARVSSEPRGKQVASGADAGGRAPKAQGSSPWPLRALQLPRWLRGKGDGHIDSDETAAPAGAASGGSLASATATGRRSGRRAALVSGGESEGCGGP